MAHRLTRIVRNPNPDSADAPMLVLLHGLGSNERDLMGLAPELDGRLRIVAIRAPFGYDGGGFAWFSINWEPSGITVDAQQAKLSRDLLLEDLDELVAEFAPRKLVLGGFSQGAIMSLAAGLQRPELFAGLLLLSGRDVPEFYPDASDGIAGIPCLIQHGVHDNVLPVQGARDMRDSLIRLGADVEYREYSMAHQINFQSLNDARIWLDGILLQN